jgi:hypothetical protein
MGTYILLNPLLHIRITPRHWDSFVEGHGFRLWDIHFQHCRQIS